MDTQTGTAGISRRRLVKGAAWAVPAVAVVAASPAYADSVCPDVKVKSVTNSGNKQVTVVIEFPFATTRTFTLVVTNVTSTQTGNTGISAAVTTSKTITPPATGSFIFSRQANGTTTPPSQTVTVTYDLYIGTQASGVKCRSGGTFTFNFTGS